MKRYLNKFVIRHKLTKKVLKVGDDSFNQKYIYRYVDAFEYLALFCRQWKLELNEFEIIPFDGQAIETNDTFSPKDNETLEVNKVFSGKGLRLKTFERTFDFKYKVGTFQPAEIRFLESEMKFKGLSVIFHQTKKRPKKNYFDSTEQWKRAQHLHDNFELRLPEFDITDHILKLIHQGLNKVQVYKQLRGVYPMSNNQLNKLIATI